MAARVLGARAERPAARGRDPPAYHRYDAAMSRTSTVIERRLPSRWACTALLLALAGGCSRATTPSSPPSAPGPSPAPGDDDIPPPDTEPPPPAPGPCATGGRLWDGKPVDCSYEHAGCCYGTAAAACAAAGCDEGQCQVLESYPAQIRCEAR
jgi:hypothetical protein